MCKFLVFDSEFGLDKVEEDLWCYPQVVGGINRGSVNGTMKLLAWNCRGVGLDSTIRCLKDHIQIKKPQFIFLCETKADANKSSNLLKSFVNFNYFVVASRGLAGGLWCMWEADLDIQYISCIYGSPQPLTRRNQWQLLESFLPPNDAPWLCIGDFNDVACIDEKRGGPPVPASQIKHFTEAIQNCMLMDVGFIGSPYTWCNNQQGLRRVFKRLDRAMCNAQWRTLFPNAQLHHVLTVDSDHKLLMLDCVPMLKKLKRPFRFEAMWLSDPTCKEVVHSVVQPTVNGSPSYILCRKLARC
ncbi:hypothetical protein IFM89_012143 [Coptis chinensis]|uniref:Endonuclease/exonuclease/phosphatase domain-containing protein n=1 Tax=Coptis chinensis TaxID=261450 RepID=A0A835M343_9MAGN|nr:hypothetical protein IFM89_012143 [Coptis chinensis]